MENVSFLSNYLISKGYRINDNAGAARFTEFTSRQSELQALATGVGCRDISERAQFKLTGADALDFLNRISTNELKNLQEGMAAQTIFTNEKGKVLDSVFVARQTDGIILIGHENKSKLLAFWMNKFIIGDDVKIADISGENYILEFLGPQALPLLMYLFGESINPLKAGASVPVGIKSYALQVLAPEQTAGKIAYWVMGSPVALIDVLETCFSNSILFDFKMIGIEAYEEYRIENGIIDSRELTDQFNPYDLDIIRDVSFTKGCYIGQEVIARLDTYKKTQKSLRTFILKEVIPANGAFDIVDERGNVIGALTSATQSSRRNGSIGIGIIQNEYNKAGTEVRIKNSTVSIPAIVKEIHPL